MVKNLDSVLQKEVVSCSSIVMPDSDHRTPFDNGSLSIFTSVLMKCGITIVNRVVMVLVYFFTLIKVNKLNGRFFLFGF